MRTVIFLLSAYLIFPCLTSAGEITLEIRPQGEVSDEKQAEVLKTLTEAYAMSKPDFKGSIDIRVQIYLRASSRVAVNTVDHMILGYDFEGVGEAGSSEVCAKCAPVWMHEFGHQIFDFELAAVNRPWGDFYTEAYGYLKGGWRDKYRDLVDSVQVKILKHITRPYSELFADVFALVYFDKADAMASVLGLERGYGGIVDPKSVASMVDRIYYSHEMLFPAGTVIWQLYLEARQSRMPKSEFLKRCFDAMATQIQKIQESGVYPTDTVGENKALIAELKSQFEKKEPAPITATATATAAPK
ncbi:MAG: hypothetical protein AB1540_00445 [Bdellovibrionota bacterium]